MFVEDILVAISNKIAVTSPMQYPFAGLLDSGWYRSFISSVTIQIDSGRALSTNQSQMILKLVRRVRPYIVEYGLASARDLEHLFMFPQHRQLPYESVSMPREARYLGDNLLALRCKADRLVIAEIKALDDRRLDPSHIYVRARPHFDWSHKIWIVPVHRFNLHALQTLLREHRFHLDAATARYLQSCHDSADAPSCLHWVDQDGAPAALLACVRDNDILAAWMISIGGGLVL